MIQSTCIYLECQNQFLMMYRNKKKNDVNAGKWIGIGGKFLTSETAVECAVRETQEETGLLLSKEQFHLHGTVDFYVENRFDEKIWIYVVSLSEFPVISQCEEGTMEWIPLTEIMNLSLWDGDRIFLENLCRNPKQSYDYQFYYDKKGCLVKHIESVKTYE